VTPDERQALREKHQIMMGCDGLGNDQPICEECSETLDGQVFFGEWPCDVIKVLDAWEATL